MLSLAEASGFCLGYQLTGVETCYGYVPPTALPTLEVLSGKRSVNIILSKFSYYF